MTDHPDHHLNAYLDGNEVCITSSRFVNLQESPALFYEQDSLMGRKALAGELDFYEAMRAYDLLATQLGQWDCSRWGEWSSGYIGPCRDCEPCEIFIGAGRD